MMTSAHSKHGETKPPAIKKQKLSSVDTDNSDNSDSKDDNNDNHDDHHDNKSKTTTSTLVMTKELFIKLFQGWAGGRILKDCPLLNEIKSVFVGVEVEKRTTSEFADINEILHRLETETAGRATTRRLEIYLINQEEPWEERHIPDFEEPSTTNPVTTTIKELVLVDLVPDTSWVPILRAIAPELKKVDFRLTYDMISYDSYLRFLDLFFRKNSRDNSSLEFVGIEEIGIFNEEDADREIGKEIITNLTAITTLKTLKLIASSLFLNCQFDNHDIWNCFQNTRPLHLILQEGYSGSSGISPALEECNRRQLQHFLPYLIKVRHMAGLLQKLSNISGLTVPYVIGTDDGFKRLERAVEEHKDICELNVQYMLNIRERNVGHMVQVEPIDDSLREWPGLANTTIHAKNMMGSIKRCKLWCFLNCCKTKPSVAPSLLSKILAKSCDIGGVNGLFLHVRVVFQVYGEILKNHRSR
jgi:hypothetical protein